MHRKHKQYSEQYTMCTIGKHLNVLCDMNNSSGHMDENTIIICTNVSITVVGDNKKNGKVTK